MTIVTSTQSQSQFSSTVISVIVYGLKIFGLAPFSVQTKKLAENSNRTCKRAFLFSKMGLTYNILLIVLIPVMSGILFPRLLSLTSEYSSSVARVADISQGIFCVFTFWIILMNWAFNQRKAACIMNKFAEIDVKLSGTNKQLTNKITYVFVAVNVIINTFTWVNIWVMDFVDPVIANIFVSFFFFSVTSFVIYWFIIEYFIVVGLVASRLAIVNKNLSSFNEFCNYSSCPSFLNDYLAGWSLSTHNQLNALNLLRNIRTTLLNLAREIAEFFSFPILACVAYFFFSLLYNFYFLMTRTIFRNDELKLINIFGNVSWIFISLYPLILLFFNVTRTLTEVKITGRLVHKLLSSAVRDEIKTELKIFSLELLHENINFTAYGFFTLDFTLLHSMLGATATYLVILIQFQ